MKFGFGVDVGGTTVKIASFDERGVLQEKWEIPTRLENNGGEILPDIARSLQDYCRRCGITQVLGVGIGVPGPVTDDGVVNGCVNLGWGKFNIAQKLRELTGFYVVAGNDATVAALGECRRGGGKGRKNVVMVTLGTGVGGGIVVGGKLIHGANGAGGEIGHVVINRQETRLCNCGKRGCVEQYCSATGIVRLVKAYLEDTEKDSVLRGKEFACKDVFEFAKQGDEACQAALEQVYAYLGEFLANICCVVDPEIVVLGGGVSKAGAPLLEGVKRCFSCYTNHFCADTEIVLATLGNDAGVCGAFEMLLEN